MDHGANVNHRDEVGLSSVVFYTVCSKVAASASTLLAQRQEGYPACTNVIQQTPKGFPSRPNGDPAYPRLSWKSMRVKQ